MRKEGMIMSVRGWKRWVGNLFPRSGLVWEVGRVWVEERVQEGVRRLGVALRVGIINGGDRYAFSETN